MQGDTAGLWLWCRGWAVCACCHSLFRPLCHLSGLLADTFCWLSGLGWPYSYSSVPESPKPRLQTLTPVFCSDESRCRLCNSSGFSVILSVEQLFWKSLIFFYPRYHSIPWESCIQIQHESDFYLCKSKQNCFYNLCVLATTNGRLWTLWTSTLIGLQLAIIFITDKWKK